MSARLFPLRGQAVVAPGLGIDLDRLRYSILLDHRAPIPHTVPVSFGRVTYRIGSLRQTRGSLCDCFPRRTPGLRASPPTGTLQ